MNSIFRTEIIPEKSTFRIDFGDPGLALGSCFGERMGSRLQECKFDMLVNPFGTVFNPVALLQLLELVVRGGKLDEELIISHGGLHKPLQLTGSFADENPARVKQLFEEKSGAVLKQLKKTRYCLFTFGNAFGYLHAESGKLVSNCQKIPAPNFRKLFHSPEEIAAAFVAFHASLSVINPDIRFIITVSPVRHTRDGLVNNSLSKAVLRYAAQLITARIEQASYFPGFELLIDDLRGYRFYADDMIHPSLAAEEYIWSKFCSTYFTEETLSLVEEIGNLKRLLSHRPGRISGIEFEKYLIEIRTQISRLEGRVDLREEKQILERYSK